MKDKLNCPYCHFLYEEDFIEPIIRSSFKCEQCDGKITVALNDKGYVFLRKRKDRMYYATLKIQRESDYRYLDKIKKQYITDTTGKYSDELSQTFFKKGQVPWVKESRILMSDDARMLGIPIQTIVSYFKLNGGKIDYRTINSYTNNL